jgi:hypothetical protein
LTASRVLAIVTGIVTAGYDGEIARQVGYMQALAAMTVLLQHPPGTGASDPGCGVVAAGVAPELAGVVGDAAARLGVVTPVKDRPRTSTASAPVTELSTTSWAEGT